MNKKAPFRLTSAEGPIKFSQLQTAGKSIAHAELAVVEQPHSALIDGL
jgi:hypothetical protein